MKIKDEEAWRSWQENNTDFYGSGVIRYAEKWAEKANESGGVLNPAMLHIGE